MRDKVTLIETRPCFRDPTVWTENPVAQFRLDNNAREMDTILYGSNSQWHLYDIINPSADFDDMLKALDRDPREYSGDKAYERK